MKRNQKSGLTNSNSRKSRREAVGVAIRNRRKMLKLNQPQLAAKIGKSVPTVSKIEGGKHPLDVDTFADVAHALNTSTTRLLWEA